jgi:hypothetical protein
MTQEQLLIISQRLMEKKPLDENVTFYKDAKFSSDALVQNENDDDK